MFLVIYCLSSYFNFFDRLWNIAVFIIKKYWIVDSLVMDWYWSVVIGTDHIGYWLIVLQVSSFCAFVSWRSLFWRLWTRSRVVSLTTTASSHTWRHWSTRQKRSQRRSKRQTPQWLKWIAPHSSTFPLLSRAAASTSHWNPSTRSLRHFYRNTRSFLWHWGGALTASAEWMQWVDVSDSFYR